MRCHGGYPYLFAQQFLSRLGPTEWFRGIPWHNLHRYIKQSTHVKIQSKDSRTNTRKNKINIPTASKETKERGAETLCAIPVMSTLFLDDWQIKRQRQLFFELLVAPVREACLSVRQAEQSRRDISVYVFLSDIFSQCICCIHSKIRST